MKVKDVKERIGIESVEEISRKPLNWCKEGFKEIEKIIKEMGRDETTGSFDPHLNIFVSQIRDALKKQLEELGENF